MEGIATPMVADLSNTIAKMIQWLGYQAGITKEVEQELKKGHAWEQEQAFKTSATYQEVTVSD